MRLSTQPTKWHRGFWAFAVALAAGTLLASERQSAPDGASDILADSVTGFSNQQGGNGWSYGYWNRSVDLDGIYHPSTDFQLFPQFGDDPINGLSRRTDFTTGKLWMLEDGRFYTAIWAEGASSNGTTSLAPQSKVEHTAVRRWVSTVEGDVTISGHVAKILAWGGDHNKVHIVVDGAAVFSTALAPPTKADRDAIFIGGEDYSVRIKVQVGSLVDFLVSPAAPETGGAFGPVKFTATIRTDREVRAGSGREIVNSGPGGDQGAGTGWMGVASQVAERALRIR